MKTLIPLSGGGDSAALLYHYLTKTNDEVITFHHRDPWQDRRFPGGAEREQRCMVACVHWLREHTRPFDLKIEEGQTISTDGTALNVERMLPLRPGFTHRMDARNLLMRYATHGHVAAKLAADRLLHARTSWDTKLGWEKELLAIYRSYTDVPIEFPFLHLGRFEVHHSMPPELRALTTPCRAKEEPCGKCIRCYINRYWDTVCAGRSIEEIRRIDERIEELGKFGRFGSLADPETYQFLDSYWPIIELQT